MPPWRSANSRPSSVMSVPSRRIGSSSAHRGQHGNRSRSAEPRLGGKTSSSSIAAPHPPAAAPPAAFYASARSAVIDGVSQRALGLGSYHTHADPHLQHWLQRPAVRRQITKAALSEALDSRGARVWDSALKYLDAGTHDAAARFDDGALRADELAHSSSIAYDRRSAIDDFFRSRRRRILLDGAKNPLEYIKSVMARDQQQGAEGATKCTAHASTPAASPPRESSRASTPASAYGVSSSRQPSRASAAEGPRWSHRQRHGDPFQEQGHDGGCGDSARGEPHNTLPVPRLIPQYRSERRAAAQEHEPAAVRRSPRHQQHLIDERRGGGGKKQVRFAAPSRGHGHWLGPATTLQQLIEEEEKGDEVEKDNDGMRSGASHSAMAEAAGPRERPSESSKAAMGLGARAYRAATVIQAWYLGCAVRRLLCKHRSAATLIQRCFREAHRRGVRAAAVTVIQRAGRGWRARMRFLHVVQRRLLLGSEARDRRAVRRECRSLHAALLRRGKATFHVAAILEPQARHACNAAQLAELLLLRKFECMARERLQRAALVMEAQRFADAAAVDVPRTLRCLHALATLRKIEELERNHVHCTEASSWRTIESAMRLHYAATVQEPALRVATIMAEHAAARVLTLDQCVAAALASLIHDELRMSEALFRAFWVGVERLRRQRELQAGAAIMAFEIRVTAATQLIVALHRSSVESAVRTLPVGLRTHAASVFLDEHVDADGLWCQQPWECAGHALAEPAFAEIVQIEARDRLVIANWAGETATVLRALCKTVAREMVQRRVVEGDACFTFDALCNHEVQSRHLLKDSLSVSGSTAALRLRRSLMLKKMKELLQSDEAHGWVPSRVHPHATHRQLLMQQIKAREKIIMAREVELSGALMRFSSEVRNAFQSAMLHVERVSLACRAINGEAESCADAIHQQQKQQFIQILDAALFDLSAASVDIGNSKNA